MVSRGTSWGSCRGAVLVIDLVSNLVVDLFLDLVFDLFADLVLDQCRSHSVRRRGSCGSSAG